MNKIWFLFFLLPILLVGCVQPRQYVILRPTIIDVREDCYKDIEGPPNVLGYYLHGGSHDIDYICTDSWGETLEHELKHQRDQIAGKQPDHIRLLRKRGGQTPVEARRLSDN